MLVFTGVFAVPKKSTSEKMQRNIAHFGMKPSLCSESLALDDKIATMELQVIILLALRMKTWGIN